MNKNINTSIIGTIIVTTVIFGGLVLLNENNIKIEMPIVSITQPTKKQTTVNTTKIGNNEQLLNEDQSKKLTYDSDKLGVSFDYEISGNHVIICESGNFIFDTENNSCPKTQEDIDFALTNTEDVILEIFTKNQDKSLELSIEDILTKEKANPLNCNIDFSQKDFLYKLNPNKQVATIFAKGNICSLNNTFPDAKPCKRAEDICSKYVNNTLTTFYNFFIYNPEESKTKFIFHQCNNCYESTPDITIDLNSIKFNKK